MVCLSGQLTNAVKINSQKGPERDFKMEKKYLLVPLLWPASETLQERREKVLVCETNKNNNKLNTNLFIP